MNDSSKAVQIELNHIPQIPDHNLRSTERYTEWNADQSKIDTKNTSYNEFFNNFMLKNKPCVIKNVAECWVSVQKWIKDEKIDYEYFSNTYGSLDAPVANCTQIAYNSQSKTDMKVKEFMEYMQNSSKQELLYLKDWHLKRTLPDDNFYTVPNMFASDWLNEYCIDNNEDDFMFVYIGPSGSWTPLHSDVYCSYSWSVNIVGRKKWSFFPPGEEEKLKDKLGNLPLLFKPENYSNIKYFEVIQDKGDVLFVPSGWYHQVVNVMDTISINHNWINGCNISIIWDALIKSLKSVEHEIEEFKETPEFFSQCQLILKSCFGMDLEKFIKFVTYIGNKRYKQFMYTEESPLLFKTYYFGRKHLKFDLININCVMNSIVNYPDIINKKIIMDELFFALKSKICDILT